MSIPATPNHPRTAILLYGLLRSYRTTAASLVRHVVEPNNGSIFYFGPSASDSPTRKLSGQHDVFGSMVANPKAGVDQLVPVDSASVATVYGQHLKAWRTHDELQSRFVAEAEQMCERRDWLFQLNPARMFSMFFNMQGVVRLFLEHEQVTGERYDVCIITRPDLAFYGALTTHDTDTLEPAEGEVHIPEGEGFSRWGEKRIGNAPILHYKNVHTGDFVPGGRRLGFNDQVIVLHRRHIELFRDLHEDLGRYMQARVPISPETVLYLHLVGRARLRAYLHPEWTYEIFRSDIAPVQNVVDTPEIEFADRHHPVAVERRSQRRVVSLFRDTKYLLRKVAGRILR